MRIRRVTIGSFGGLRDRTYEFSDGLNVIHGPNESGKTTVTEFIRSALSPTNRRKVYPERARTDSGSVAYEQDGEKEVRLVQKGREGDIPELPKGVEDPDFFRSVFAMGIRDLEDEGAVEGVRSRFLSVPGGEGMPRAMGTASDLADKKIGRTSRSPSEVNSLTAAISENRARVAEARKASDSYGELDSRRTELRARLEGLRAESVSSSGDRRIHDLYESNASNYERLKQLKAERSSLGAFVPVTDSDRALHEELAGRRDSAQAARDALESSSGNMAEGLRGADRREVNACSGEIEALPGRLEAYRRDAAELRSMPRDDGGTGAGRSSRLGMPLVVAGMVMAALGAVASTFVGAYSLILTAAGAAVLVVGLVGLRSASFPSDSDGLRRSSLESSVSSFESDVSRLMARLGLEGVSVERDVQTLSEVRAAAAALSAAEGDLMRGRLAAREAENDLMRFYQRFAGEEGFRESIRKTARAASVDAEIRGVSDALRAAGLDPEVPECPVEYSGDTTSEEIEEASRELGTVEERMRAIIGEEGLERLMDERSRLESGLSEALIEGAVGLVASAIADMACEEMYSEVQPGVIATADRYLSMMTGGLYRIDTDPRSKELSVRGSEGAKPIGMWSSGLRAQVLLSMKLAIAREIGGGQVPVILDDVLITFDSSRKEGACRALADVGREMQVLMFTCDSETAAICRGIEGVSVSEM